MKWIKKIFGISTKDKCVIHNIRFMLSDSKLTEHQKTDVLLDFVNVPFATLTESELNNAWYLEHVDCDYVFHLTASGFKLTKYEQTNIKKIY